MNNYKNKAYAERYTHPASMHALVSWINNNIRDFQHSNECECWECDYAKHEYWMQFQNDCWAANIPVLK